MLVNIFASILICALLLLPAASLSTGNTPDKFSVPSPDGKFIFRQTVEWNSEDGEAAFTVIDARTKRSVLTDLSADLPPMEDSITCLWSPDSKRFAVNARIAGRHTTTELFEWTGKDFHHIPSIENLITALVAAVRKQELKNAPIPPGGTLLHVWDTYKALEWQDSDTLKIFAASTRSYAPTRISANTTNLTSSSTFTLQFQKNGPPKIIAQNAPQLK